MILDHEQLERVRSAYEEADKAIKQYERYTLATPVAAINQLRYAGYHLLQAQLLAAQKKESNTHLENAFCHCKRAYSDAFEGIIYSHLGFIADFQNLCRSRNGVESVYPEYADDYAEIVAVQERLQCVGSIQAMSQNNKDDVLNIAATVTRLKRKILKVKHHVDALVCRREIDEAKRIAQQFLVPFVATVVGTVVGILGLLIGVWSMLPKSPWCRLCGVAAILTAGYFVVKLFFRWSVNHMLTETQRQVLRKEYGLRL